jgi:CRP-like cAMP-binding protein
LPLASENRRPRILVAEDNDVMAQEVGDLIQGCGYALAESAMADDELVFGNALLDSLGDDDRIALHPELERVSLRVGDRLEPAGCAAAHVYFPVEGLLSIFAGATPGTRIEIASIGREGMTAPDLALGGPAMMSELMVQVAGSAWRTATATLRQQVLLRPALQRLLLDRSGAMLCEIVESASYNGRATIAERLARWLLQASSRISSRQLAITHEALSEVLGVRRPSVSTGLQVLEGRRLIRATRRMIVLLDLDGLSGFARR